MTTVLRSLAALIGSMVLLSACGGDGGGGGSTPITERLSRATYTCSVARTVTDHAPRTWRSTPTLVVTSGGVAYLLRTESMPSMPFMPAPGQLLNGSLTADGVFGATTVIPSGAPQNLGPAAAVPRGDGFVAVWGESGKLRFATFDAAGGAQAPKDVVTGVDEIGSVQLAAGADGGFGVVYTASPDTNNHQAHFVVVGPDGDVRGGPRRLDQTAQDVGYGRRPAPAIAGGASGYAMIWRNLGDDRGGIEFAKARADGTETVPRRRISGGDGNTVVGGTAGFEAPVNALIESDGGYLAAWVQVESSSSTVWLARLDASGVRLGAPAPLRAAANAVDEVEPTLVPYGDAVAVLWARGSHIFVCGGCVPDHRIDLILLDPTDLTPVSNVVSLSNDAPIAGPRGPSRGGLLRRQVARLGQSLLTTFDVTFHVHHTSASAALSCQR